MFSFDPNKKNAAWFLEQEIVFLSIPIVSQIVLKL